MAMCFRSSRAMPGRRSILQPRTDTGELLPFSHHHFLLLGDFRLLHAPRTGGSDLKAPATSSNAIFALNSCSGFVSFLSCPVFVRLGSNCKRSIAGTTALRRSLTTASGDPRVGFQGSPNVVVLDQRGRWSPISSLSAPSSHQPWLAAPQPPTNRMNSRTTMTPIRTLLPSV